MNQNLITEEWLEDQGYFNCRKINGKWYALQRMIFTVGVMCEIDHISPANGRICFNDLLSALSFLNEWDGLEPPLVGRDGCMADKRTRRPEMSDEEFIKALDLV